ncbi:MAG: hypothetical protein KAJ37_13615 [Candidatus Krumholzibacteria bacterium]|nr:hypothetical protein [Candidatus Krumholzibacteria bacterium]
MKHFDRRLILLLSLFGPAMGVLTLFGIIPDGVDRFFWLAISIACAVVIARRAPQHAFGHGAIVGFLLGASAKLIQGIWSGVYIAHNPGLLEKFSEEQSKMPQGTEFKYYVLMLVPFVGIASSLIVGLLSHFAFKSLGRDRDRS